MDSTILEPPGNGDEQYYAAERALLALLLCPDVDVDTLIRRVDSKLLSYRSGRIFRVAARLRKDGGRVSASAIRAEMSSDRDYEAFDSDLREIEATRVDVDYADEYVERFTEMACLRRLDRKAAELRIAIQYGASSEAAGRIVREMEVPDSSTDIFGPVPIGELIDQYEGQQREPVIEGIVRVGEIAQIIAASKVGKSWFGYGIALSVCTGRPWLGRFATKQGRVLLIDNELHPETLSYRIPKVADALSIPESEYRRALEVLSLRGRLMDYHGLSRHLSRMQPGEFDLILVDAHYRMMPDGVPENGNSEITQIYNLLDCYAEQTQAAWFLVHHASKGSQSNKSIVDVGAGAGAQSRAADTHLVLREHEKSGHVVLEAEQRTSVKLEPITLKWEFPLWIPTDVNPAMLKRPSGKSDARQAADDLEGIEKLTDALATLKGVTLSELERKGIMSKGRAKKLFDLMESDGLVERQSIVRKGNNCELYTLKET